MKDISCEQINDFTNILQSVVSILAIIIGGIVAWRRFFREKPHTPRANLRHEITCKKIDERNYFIRVSVTIENTGNVKLQFIEGQTTINKILPLDTNMSEQINTSSLPVCDTTTEYAWPEIDKRVYPMKILGLMIDSGEIDKLNSEFILPVTNKLVLIKSVLKVKGYEEDDTIWPVMDILELQQPVNSELI